MSDEIKLLQREVKFTVSGIFILTLLLNICSWFSIASGLFLFFLSEVGFFNVIGAIRIGLKRITFVGSDFLKRKTCFLDYKRSVTSDASAQS